MIISDRKAINKTADKNIFGSQHGDILNIEMINRLPHPLTARLYNGSEHWIESLCVQTGCMRLDVSGQIDLNHFDNVKRLIDADGNEHMPDGFWIE